MSESMEKVSGIEHLPVFPLPLVLLPNELLPLHIFEPRYRQMLKDIRTEKNIFGVSYFVPKEDFIEKPGAGTIGCAAEIREAQELSDGRSNILTIGLVRYKLIGYLESGEPYFVAEIEFFEDDEEESALLEPLAGEVFATFGRVARAAHKLSGERTAFPDIPQAEPEALSFLVMAAFNLETELKYELLETRSTIARLERLREILDQSVGKMEESAEISRIARTNGHSPKKIDI
jgi:Lon protease-like protein